MTLLLLTLLSCGRAPGIQPYPDETGQDPVRIQDIDPSWGPQEGGTAVEITGLGFEGLVTVRFGEQPVAVTKLDPTTLLVSSPAGPFGQAVDVTVVSDLGEAVAEEGFLYSDTPPDTDTDTDTDWASGLTGGVAELSLLQIACPDCFGYTSALDIYASVAVHEPTSGSWLSWLPSEGTCALDPVQAPLASTTLDLGEWAYLSAGSTALALRRTQGDGGPTYTASGLTEADYITNSSYDLSVPDGGSWGPFDVDDAVLTPQGWDTIEPWQMLLTSPQQAFTAQLSRAGATITWSPSGGSGTFVVLLGIYNPQGTALLASLLCRGPDNGAMNLPGGYLSAYPQGSLVAVYIYRYQISSRTIPANGATLESVAQLGVLGPATLR